VGIVNHGLGVHVVAAAREGDPQLLAHLDEVCVLDPIYGLDLAVGEEAREVDGGDLGEGVVLGDGVDGEAVGVPGEVGAAAGDGDSHGAVDGDWGGGWGGQGEVVHPQQGPQGLHLEQRLDGPHRGWPARGVPNQGFAGALASALERGGWLSSGRHSTEKKDQHTQLQAPANHLSLASAAYSFC